MPVQHPYQVIAIPLNRPDVVAYLEQQLQQTTVGARLNILAQRPTQRARRQLVHSLRRNPTLSEFLAMHDPHHHVVQTTTSQLVPLHFLREPGFLTRNMGGWSPLYFGVVQLIDPLAPDPLMKHTNVLQTYGERIQYFGPQEPLIEARLATETGLNWPHFHTAVLHVANLREFAVQDHNWRSWASYSEQIYHWLETAAGWDDSLVTLADVPIPRLLLLDELLHFLVHIETERRMAALQHDTAVAEAIATWQESFTAVSNLHFILKGEYIMGRSRRSTVLILPELGVVVKQPGLEPFHEVELGAQTYRNEPENWPHLLEDGSLVTAAGRIRIILEDGLIPRLNKVFKLKVLFSSLFGLSVEPHIVGPTFQEYIWANPQRLNLGWYEQILRHQQVCEQLNVENGDWHSANFIVDEKKQRLTHIDWGAARQLHPAEKTEAEIKARLNQVQNIAYSFNDEALAQRVLALHKELVNSAPLLAQVQRDAAHIAHSK